ncbi:MAG: NnrS family protein [Albimonas sp.]|uniref:NnrS family protein n=1 Tax=Albimonas sp. TaxID=1872425 RepID=UPI004057959B
MTHPAEPPGPALLSGGFRPFFLVAGLFGLTAVPAWMLVRRGALELGGPFHPVDWHIHEMLFGYVAAVVAGFLFTAVPNWTGRMPTRGWPLAALAALWLAGRLAVAGLAPLGPLAAAAVDCAFLAAIAAMIAREIVAGRNWRNLKVVVPVLLLLAANVAFHAEAAMAGSSDLSRRLGVSAGVFLVMLIGGRIIPSFTRNWLAQRRADRLPAPFGRFDGIALGVSAAGLAAWVGAPGTGLAAAGLALGGAAQAARMARWRGAATWRSPLLAMLHVAFAFVPLGLLAAAMGEAGWIAPAAGLHLLGIGAMAAMTLAVMVRAARGHTGRSLVAGRGLSLAFALLVAAALLRALEPLAGGLAEAAVELSALAWTAAFALFAWRATPWLLRPRVGRKSPSSAPR